MSAGDATVDALRVAAAAAGLTLGGLLFGDFVHDPTGPQQLQAAPGEAGAAAAAGQGQGEEPAPAPAAAKRKTRAKAKAAEGEGTAAATGPARYAPGGAMPEEAVSRLYWARTIKECGKRQHLARQRWLLSTFLSAFLVPYGQP